MKPHVAKGYHALFVQSSKQRVLDVLFRYPEKEFSLSDMAKEAKVSKPHMGIIISELELRDFITVVRLTKIWRIKANTQNENFIQSKIVYNLGVICLSGLVGFLNDYFGNPKAIVLFGSFRKGEDFSNSDIDIAVETEGLKEFKTIELRELSAFEKEFGRKIQIHVFHRKSIDSHVFNNIANGVVLHGFLEVKP